MTNTTDQYALETTWSTRLTDDIILESIQGKIPLEMESNILGAINTLNSNQHIDNKEIFIKVFSLILKDRNRRPIQEIATQIGISAGIPDARNAFEWGIILLKECKDSGLYNFRQINDEWYICPNFTLDIKTQQRLDKLQYLPPMKAKPIDWTNNENGGWFWESKHLVLGNRFNRHDEPLAYDAINKLQSIAWEIDPDTYLFEEQTNHMVNKKQFLKVMDEYLGSHFYFVWRYDSRGRSYSSGYDLNLQSNEYGKSLLSLHNKELISETGLPNLYIAIANHAGKDKLTWQDRYDWAIMQDLDKVVWDEPILGRKAVRALKDTQKGKPTGYVMSLDATSSGIQIMAVLSGCKETAKLVNCIDPNTRYDLYTEIAEMMNQKLSKPVSRKVIKQVAMTHFYNSKATPKALLSSKELEVFYEVIAGLLPGAEAVMNTINDCWNYDADYHSWIMPDGHTAYTAIVEGTSGIYADNELGNIPLRWYHKTKSDNYRSLCPNVIHSIDGYVAREMVRRCDFQLSHVHDCFVFNPNHLQKVSKTYREIMADIANSNLFSSILGQITGGKSAFNFGGTNQLAQDILNSQYMLS
tara:strand:+ start:936 stop:2684 length:1749 start_codon:yes stop_codon:yes gene_type:complete